MSVLQIFVLVCQTELQFDSRRWVLSLIRLASFNPILDPWVYILFRRELVWRLVKFCRWLLRLHPLQHPLHLQQSLLVKDPGGGGVVAVNGGGVGVGVGGGGGGGGAGAGGGGGGGGRGGDASDGARRRPWEDPYNPSCLAFCYQCLCLPPAPRAAQLASKRLSLTTCHTNRSPSLVASRKASTGEQPGGSRSPCRSTSRLALKPPSPCERLLLIKMTEAGGSSRSVNSVV